MNCPCSKACKTQITERHLQDINLGREQIEKLNNFLIEKGLK